MIIPSGSDKACLGLEGGQGSVRALSIRAAKGVSVAHP